MPCAGVLPELNNRGLHSTTTQFHSSLQIIGAYFWNYLYAKDWIILNPPPRWGKVSFTTTKQALNCSNSFISSNQLSKEYWKSRKIPEANFMDIAKIYIFKENKYSISSPLRQNQISVYLIIFIYQYRVYQKSAQF